MKQLLLVMVSLFLLILGGCSTVIPPHMVVGEKPQAIVPPADKALLVVAQEQTSPFTYGIAAVVDTFLDDEFIGQTYNYTYFTRVVAPGERYIYSYAEADDGAAPISVAKFTFEAGKAYYIRFSVRSPPKAFSTLTSIEPLAPGRIDFSRLKYLEFNSNPGAIVLTDKERIAARKAFDSNPEENQAILNYKGY